VGAPRVILIGSRIRLIVMAFAEVENALVVLVKNMEI
jgi:hypothetical protein